VVRTRTVYIVGECTSEDEPSAADAAHAEAEPAEPQRELALEDCMTQQSQEKMFPNSMKILGIKHICDNLMMAALQGMPQRHGID
jgi:hypothetical protein